MGRYRRPATIRRPWLVALSAMAAAGLLWLLFTGPLQPVVVYLRLAAGIDSYRAGRAGPQGTAVPCPGAAALTVLVIGQSNAANHVDRPSTAPPGRNVMLVGEDCYPLTDPVAGATGRQGSLWPVFAEDLARRLGRPIAILDGAVGSTAIESWSSRWGIAPAGLDRRIRKADRAGHGIGLVIWIQGESDNTRGTSRTAYADRLNRVVARIDALTGETPWLVTTTSLTRGGKLSPAVRAAQQQVIMASPRIFPGTDTDSFDRTPEDRHDGIHFSRAAADTIARDLAEKAAEILGEAGRSSTPGSAHQLTPAAG